MFCCPYKVCPVEKTLELDVIFFQSASQHLLMLSGLSYLTHYRWDWQMMCDSNSYHVMGWDAFLTSHGH
jgi:hypothetical protein